MACDNIVGLKNILLTFFDCKSGIKVGPISHKLSSNDLPQIKMCDKKLEALPGGYSKETQDHASIMGLKVIRDLRIPLAMYQGCSSVSVQLEYQNGLIYTGKDGSSTGDGKSDTHEVDLELTFTQLDELLPTSGLLAA